jgi:hypothetical protein
MVAVCAICAGLYIVTVQPRPDVCAHSDMVVCVYARMGAVLCLYIQLTLQSCLETVIVYTGDVLIADQTLVSNQYIDVLTLGKFLLYP